LIERHKCENGQRNEKRGLIKREYESKKGGQKGKTGKEGKRRRDDKRKKRRLWGGRHPKGNKKREGKRGGKNTTRV